MKNLFLTAILALTGMIGTATAGDYAHSLPAVQGYDVVSYQTGKRPVRGNGNFTAVYDGATYQFSSQANLDTFNADPARYAPAYNGYCAFGVAVGKKFIGDPEVWRVVDNKLYLNLDAGIQDMWLKDVSGRIKEGDANWKRIKASNPAAL